MSTGYFVSDPGLPELKSDEQVVIQPVGEKPAAQAQATRKRFAVPKVGETIDLDGIPYSEGGGSLW